MSEVVSCPNCGHVLSNVVARVPMDLERVRQLIDDVRLTPAEMWEPVDSNDPVVPSNAPTPADPTNP